jgi:hypothetical protein
VAEGSISGNFAQIEFNDFSQLNPDWDEKIVVSNNRKLIFMGGSFTNTQGRITLDVNNSDIEFLGGEISNG